MQLTSYDKKALTIGGSIVAAVLLVIAVATAAAVMLSPQEDHSPRLSVFAGDEYLRAEPAFWCSVELTDCEPYDPQSYGPDQLIPISAHRLPVPVGDDLLMSLPGEIANSVWGALAIYQTPDGVDQQDWFHAAGSAYGQTFTSTEDRVLLRVEVTVLSTVQDERGDYLARGLYAFDTTPGDITEIFSDQAPV